MNRYFFTPWEDEFLESIKKVEKRVILVAPFIKYSTIKKILSKISQTKKVELVLISRFTKQVFLQKSSDLDLYNLLVNYEFPNIECKCFMKNNLHSKIYIIDSKKMFITSSNLSYSGLIKNHEIAVEIDNIDEINFIENELNDLMNKKRLIDDDMIHLMSNSIDFDQYSFFRNFKKIDIESETDYDEDIEINHIDQIIDDNKKELDINIKEQISINNTLDNINRFHGLSEIQLDGFNNVKFESCGIKYEDNNILIKQEKDYKILKEYIFETFNNSLDLQNNTILFDDLTLCFIQITWLNSVEIFKYQQNNERKKFFNQLGKLFFWFIIDEKVFNSKTYTYNSSKYLHDIGQYIRKNYLFYDVLKSLKLNVYLYKNDIRRTFVEDIFYEVIGTIMYHTNFDNVKNIFNLYLDKLDEFIYDDYKDIVYKTLLQELTQQKFGLPDYKLVKESGQDHNKVFEYEIYINNIFLGRGSSYSKKLSQELAAEESVKYYLNKYGDESLNQQTLTLDKYMLKDRRILQLEKLRDKLPFKITNLKLLDISFTHLSWVKVNLSSRENSSLSHLGSSLEMFIRYYSLIKSFKELDHNDYNSLNDILKKINLSIYFERFFDINNLKEFVQVVNMEHLSTSIKVDVVRSLISLCYIELGFFETKKLVDNIWDNYKFDNDNDYMDYVSELQDFIQKNFKNSKIEYKVISEKGKDNEKVFEVGCFIDDILYGVGKGKNKKECRRLSSKETYFNEKFITKFK